MTIEGFLLLVGTLGAAVGAIAGWTFVLSYRKDPWRTHPAGVHLMRFTAGLACILSYIVVYQSVAMIVPPNPYLDGFVLVCRTIIFCWVAWQLWIRAEMLAEAHAKDKTIAMQLTDRKTTDDAQTEAETAP